MLGFVSFDSLSGRLFPREAKCTKSDDGTPEEQCSDKQPLPQTNEHA
jgi:hypothetical protein